MARARDMAVRAQIDGIVVLLHIEVDLTYRVVVGH